MTIRQYDKVLLKDGRTADIVEVFDEREFVADIGSKPEDWETICISLNEIERNITTGESRVQAA